jgi:phage shock protein PspC (stress-responsive transcriptional regulator)
VCGGLAQYFNLDAMLIRVLFVVLAGLGGSRGATAPHLVP